jgi:NitT/TauT family transport system substrate-binding protein
MLFKRFLLALAALASVTAANAQTVNLRVTIPANSLFFLPLFAAVEQGFFKSEGIEMETVITQGDGPDVDALIAGSAQFTISTPNRLLTAYQQGKPLLAVMAVMDRMGIQCFMNKEASERVGLAEAKTPEQKFAKLKGLTIAGTRPGAFTYLIAVDYLKRAGLEPQKDAKIIGVGAGPAMIAAVENGQVDLGCFGSPIIESAVSRGKSVWFINNTAGEDKSYNEFLFQILYVRPEYAKENPQLVRKVVAALLKGNNWIATAGKEELLAFVKKRFGAIDDVTLAQSIENVRPAFSKDGKITEPAFAAATKFLRDTDMLTGNVPWNAVTDNSYLPK